MIRTTIPMFLSYSHYSFSFIRIGLSSHPKLSAFLTFWIQIIGFSSVVFIPTFVYFLSLIGCQLLLLGILCSRSFYLVIEIGLFSYGEGDVVLFSTTIFINPPFLPHSLLCLLTTSSSIWDPSSTELLSMWYDKVSLTLLRFSLETVYRESRVDFDFEEFLYIMVRCTNVSSRVPGSVLYPDVSNVLLCLP